MRANILSRASLSTTFACLRFVFIVNMGLASNGWSIEYPANSTLPSSSNVLRRRLQNPCVAPINSIFNSDCDCSIIRGCRISTSFCSYLDAENYLFCHLVCPENIVWVFYHHNIFDGMVFYEALGLVLVQDQT